MHPVLWGALAMGCFAAGLLFMRLYRRTRDRLFVFFGLGFFALMGNWIALAAVEAVRESQHLIYLIRLLAFVIIIIGIVDKNRR